MRRTPPPSVDVSARVGIWVCQRLVPIVALSAFLRFLDVCVFVFSFIFLWVFTGLVLLVGPVVAFVFWVVPMYFRYFR